MLEAFPRHRDDLRQTYPTSGTLGLTTEVPQGSQHHHPSDFTRDSSRPGKELRNSFPLPLETGHHRVMLVRPALPGVKPPRLEDLDVVHARYRGRHLVTEIGVLGPLDGVLGEAGPIAAE